MGKETFVGFVLIVLGVLPMLTGISSVVASIFTSYPFLAAGQPAYQIVLIVLGIVLIYKRRYRSPMMMPAR